MRTWPTTPDTWRLFTASWQADFKSGNKSPNTIRIYRTPVGQLRDWLDRTQTDPVELDEVTADHIRVADGWRAGAAVITATGDC